VPQNKHQIGRVALREEGDRWNAYYATPDSMEDAILLASIRISAVQNPDRKQAFMDLVRNIVADTIEEATGQRPIWNEPQVAPEHERAGHAQETDLQKLSRTLVAEGKLIEAGWVLLRIAVLPDDAPQVQIDNMRFAFFAGSQHLWSSINAVLDGGSEPTAADLERMNLINDELNRFAKSMKARAGHVH
jgi:hypothetical protein